MLAGATNAETPRLAPAADAREVNGEVLPSVHDTIPMATAINAIDLRYEMRDMRQLLQNALNVVCMAVHRLPGADDARRIGKLSVASPLTLTCEGRVRGEAIG